jgi:cell division control protein 6
MGLFDETLKGEESLFLNPIVLDYDYQPKLVPFRENNQQHIASCIKPLFQERNGKNIFIFGKPGVGKTVSTRHVLNELSEKTEDIIPVYVNCWKKDTAYKIALSICEKLDYKWTHNKKTDELLKVIRSILNKKSAVFCLDEADKLQDQEIIYNLLEDIYRKTIVLITNERNWLNKLDERIRSRLLPEILEFRSYNHNQTKEILKQRSKFAFAPNVLGESALSIIADKSFKLGDIRTGLFLLKEAADIAETQSSKSIEENHAKLAILKLDSFKVKGSADLKKDEKEILDLIKQDSGKTIKEIYDSYRDKYKGSYSTFYRKVDTLKKNKIIEVDNQGKKESSIIRYKKKLTDF